MKLSDYVIDFLASRGVNHIFEMTGGAITHLLDSAGARPDVECVSVHHEQAAAFAAEAYARTNGSLGAAMATSGPGALNLLTGIGSCFFDSVPCLFITGQVNTFEFKFELPIRQLGFQETDIVGIAKPITKWAELVTDPGRIRFALEKAVHTAQKGRPGPVLLDLPMNVQRADIDPERLESFYDSNEYREYESALPVLDGRLVDQAMDLLIRADRPLMLVGGGVRASGAAELARTFADFSGIPCVSSLLGLDAIPFDQKLSFGLIGSYGHRYSNLAVANCDVLLVIGSRLDTRQTGTRPETFARGAVVVHVDIDVAELNRKVKADLAIRCDAKAFLSALCDAAQSTEWPAYAAWHEALNGWRDRYPTRNPSVASDGIDPNLFMELLAERSSDGDIVCLDVGQHQMWASQSFRLRPGQRLLNAGGMGAMGFGLPAALGAAKAAVGSRVIAILGDGGLQVNIQELDTVLRHRLPVKLFVMNNRHLGMVRQFQDMYFDGRHQSTVVGYGCPDLVAIAQAYGWNAYRLDGWEAADAVIAHALSQEGCVLVDVRLDLTTTVNPKLTVGRPLEDMSPFLERDELKRTMIIDPLDS
ncbi:thiamine pyrophosphate-binding protein [Cohnella faecalis]|uniref:Thiamine pyrophosphate-binding protein n=1 Tax=Cohnella faecalis TaxID=2315694 RepID=A0A398CJF2_9BACL|nr:thiamine pyrophosphate-binding protein [Cohnella faecalis]RIE02823.1 thiamine pyrophosphate-binding protein [Cohnella faecalis]